MNSNRIACIIVCSINALSKSDWLYPGITKRRCILKKVSIKHSKRMLNSAFGAVDMCLLIRAALHRKLEVAILLRKVQPFCLPLPFR